MGPRADAARPRTAASYRHGVLTDRSAFSNFSELSWTLNAYAIVFAALLVLAGKVEDYTSSKAGFLLGVEVFLVSSTASARVNSPRSRAETGLWPL